MALIEIVGIMGATLILISFLLSGEKNIRMVNIIGAVLFIIYGLISWAISILFLNVALFIIHFYKLSKLKKEVN